MKSFLIGNLLFLFTISFAVAQEKPSLEAESFFNNAMSQINRRHVNWVKTSAATLNQKKMSDADAQKMASTYGLKNNLSNSDIEALAFLVLMEAHKSAQEDLKAIMAKVKAINKQKQSLRDMQSKLQRQDAKNVVHLDSITLLSMKTSAIQKGQNPENVKLVRSATSREEPTKAQIDAMKDKLKKDLDSMSEMGEMESLRLQMAMDRMSKMMSTISNLLKKISDTANTITQNLK